jgi:large subunit ribosomal protein L9
MKAAAVRKSAKEKGSAEDLGKQLDGVTVEFTRKSGEHDQLFGSVTSSDIAKALESKGFTIDRRKIELDVPLKAVGEFKVPVKLHREVTVTVKAIVKKDAVEEVAAPAATEESPAEAEV